jgi:hypothetical protein
MRYESALNMFLKVANFYNTNGRLPNYVTVSPWMGPSTPPVTGLRPVYIISDNINSKTEDNQRIYIMGSALNNLGDNAYNYGADDNFSPATFTGLANPDQYLLNNGYHYYEGYTNNLANQLAQIIYNEALS